MTDPAGLPHRIDVPALLAGVDIVRLIDGYVPLRKAGAEWQACCPFHSENTPSFTVSPSKQFYHCFGCGAHGNAIGFLEQYRGMSFLDACAELGADVGAGDAPRKAAAARQPPPAKVVSTPDWLAQAVAPADAPEPPKAHDKRGAPETVWTYRDAAGAVIGYVYRFRTSDGGKETLPVVWARRADGSAAEWRWMAFAQPRPLYGLDRLAARPEAPVLLVEGEKCADAAQAELPELVAVSWPGGCNAEGKADWSPLAGRKVITWADCDAKREPLSKAERDELPDPAARAAAQQAKPLLADDLQPGTRAMRAIHRRLHELEARVWDVVIPGPGEKPSGWDVADAIAEGLRGEALAAFVRKSAIRLQPPASIDPPEDPRAQEECMPPEMAGEGCGPPPGVFFPPGPPGDENWRRRLMRRDGRLVDCRENVYLLLKHHPEFDGVIWADEFSKRIVRRRPAPWEAAAGFVAGREWDPNDDLRLGLWLAQRERLLIRSIESLSKGISWVASESRWHPVREYLDSLVWDGIARVDSWLSDFMGAREGEYSRLAGRFALIGMVARIFRPGCQMRFMLIFEGAQFRGKSRALRVLGGQWFSDAPLDLHNKDTYQLIQGVWIQEIPELDSFSRADATRIKAFISSQTDRFRAPYEAAPSDCKREVVFAGTTNQDEYFKDTTGNTRFWPVRVEEIGPINIDGLAAVRDQLLAEAVALFRAEERWHPTSDEQQKLFAPEQEAREIIDPWESIIGRYLRTQVISRITVDELLTDCLKVEVGKIDRAKQQATTVGIAMKRLGWRRKRDTTGHREHYYVPPDGWGAEEPREAVGAGF